MHVPAWAFWNLWKERFLEKKRSTQTLYSNMRWGCSKMTSSKFCGKEEARLSYCWRSKWKFCCGENEGSSLVSAPMTEIRLLSTGLTWVTAPWLSCKDVSCIIGRVDDHTYAQARPHAFHRVDLGGRTMALAQLGYLLAVYSRDQSTEIAACKVASCKIGGHWAFHLRSASASRFPQGCPGCPLRWRCAKQKDLVACIQKEKRHLSVSLTLSLRISFSPWLSWLSFAMTLC